MSKEEKPFDKGIVNLCIRSVIVFTVIVLFIFYRTGQEPSTLITAFFAFFGTELLALATLKVKERKKEENIEISKMFANVDNEDMRGD